jgi:1,4-alpha-glucan branching enzyme
MLEKRYIKSRKVYQVTFELPKDIKAESVCLVGEFNDWHLTATPMKRNKQGVFRLTLELEPGWEYQFRYLVNGETWHNDWHADAYVPNGFGGNNSVVITPAAE